jgi:L-aspartate oxidase
MGGIAVDRHGRSSLKGLWACGEVAGTGLHGANRLASNSLLEALVFGERVARDILGRSTDRAATGTAPAAPPGRPGLAPRLRRLMSDQVGVIRDAGSLDTALTVLAAQAPDDDDVLVARLIAYAARARRESRGAHARADFPLAATARRFTFTLADAMADIATDAALPSRARA